VPGCGKSTWAKFFFNEYQIVSSDAIRAEKWPGEPYVAERNVEVFDVFHDRIDQMLYKGGQVVADATSLNDRARTRLRLLAKKNGAECHLVFFNNLGQALERNGDRDPNLQDWVPYEAMEFMVKKWHETKAAIIDEEYTSITSIEGTYVTTAADTADDPPTDRAAAAIPG
jgi:predicted kinase